MNLVRIVSLFYIGIHWPKLFDETHTVVWQIGVILSGGPQSVYARQAPHPDRAVFEIGVPILGALEIVADTSGNSIISGAVRQSLESVRQGQNLADPLAQHWIFPPMVTRMIGIGEPVLSKYERIVFEKPLISPQGQPLADAPLARLV